jgi:hypothetical protein
MCQQITLNLWAAFVLEGKRGRVRGGSLNAKGTQEWCSLDLDLRTAANQNSTHTPKETEQETKADDSADVFG